jgi:tripartite-type tricarboxylate transporter receptor subunit TctC
MGEHGEEASMTRIMATATAVVALVSALVCGRPAQAADYPTRPVVMVLGFAPGGPSDVMARIFGKRLEQALGQPVVIENRTGAGGNVAAEQVARAAPDGYTLLLANSGILAANAALYKRIGFDPEKDFAPITFVGAQANVLVVHPAVPARTLAELIAFAKANPGKVSFASAGVGSVSHVSGELFKFMAGVNMVHVPYRSMAPALTDLIGGQVQAIFSTMPPSIENVRAGKLRALAVTTAIRSEALPDLPTVGDFLPGYESTMVMGLGAPKNIPVEIAERLNKEIIAALADPGMKARLADLGNEPMPMTPAGFAKFIADETEKWGKVIRAANIKAE